MNEAALIKTQAKVQEIDRELLYYISDLLDGRSLLSDEHLTILIESTERELKIYEYILSLIIANSNQN